jgi:hypothetical protein
MHHTIILREKNMSQDNITPHTTFSIQYSLHSYNMIKDEVSISEKFVGLMMKPTSQSFSTLLKLELTKMNHSSVKMPIKRKIPCFFTQAFVAPACNHTICKYSLP